MTNYVIEAPGIGTLVLTTEELRSARARALELREAVEPTRTPDPPADASLVSAEQLQLRTGIPASWWMSQARERRVPHHKVGRYVRFSVAEVMDSPAVRKRGALDNVTGYSIQRGSASA